MADNTETIATIAMQSSKAWPAVFHQGAALCLWRAAVAAIETAGFSIVPTFGSKGFERDLAAARAENARLMRERDAAQEVLRGADRGSPIYKAVERVLDEHSAWIARPNDAVTRAIALAAGVAWMAREPVDPLLEEIEMRLIAARAENDKLREALECIAEEHDAGRHDGLPEPCPAHDADTMFAIACAALAEKEPAK